MVRQAHERGYPQVKQAHNAVFSALGGGGARASDMAAAGRHHPAVDG